MLWSILADAINGACRCERTAPDHGAIASPHRLERGQRAKVDLMKATTGNPLGRAMKPSARFVTAALLLIGSASAASAQNCWNYVDCSLKQRGYYGTPYGDGPQFGSGGGDQYGYGPAYSYAKQAPPGPLAPPPCVWRRVWNGHHWVHSCI